MSLYPRKIMNSTTNLKLIQLFCNDIKCFCYHLLVTSTIIHPIFIYLFQNLQACSKTVTFMKNTWNATVVVQIWQGQTRNVQEDIKIKSVNNLFALYILNKILFMITQDLLWPSLWRHGPDGKFRLHEAIAQFQATKSGLCCGKKKKLNNIDISSSSSSLLRYNKRKQVDKSKKYFKIYIDDYVKPWFVSRWRNDRRYRDRAKVWNIHPSQTSHFQTLT